MKKIVSLLLIFALLPMVFPAMAEESEATTARRLIELVNDRWITDHPTPPSYSWDNVAYYVGNNEAYFTTGIEAYKQYSLDWANKNGWKGHPSEDISSWSNSNVYHADNQTCFQIYADFYNLDGDRSKISRAIEVVGTQINTESVSYWWWCDALFMAMPVMTKLYRITGDERYGDKLYEYFKYCRDMLYDSEYHLFFRDKGYVGSRINGQKNFWSRGNGWVFAGLAMVLRDMPENWKHRRYFLDTYLEMAKGITACMKDDGRGNKYWTQSMLPLYPVSDYNPNGYETSGTAFMTYGLLYGINSGLLDSSYLPYAMGGISYLKNVAVSADGLVGYAQEIGSAATKATYSTSTQNFAVGATLLALCELYKYQSGLSGDILPYLQRSMNNSAAFKAASPYCFTGHGVIPAPPAPYGYVPVRTVAEAYGLDVDWTSSSAVISSSSKSVTLVPNSSTALINSTPITLSQNVQNINGRLYICVSDVPAVFGLCTEQRGDITIIGHKLRGFLPCEGSVLEMLSSILTSGELPYRPLQPKRLFVSSIEEFNAENRVRIVSASAKSIPEADNPPANAFDDDISSRYAATDFEAIFDLGSEKRISEVALSFWKYSNRTTAFSVSVSSDGQQYETLFDGSTVLGQRFSHIPVERSLRYIKVIGSGNTENNWTSLLEIIPFG